jgi:metal-sulfur cluster biosynthetic enzyme
MTTLELVNAALATVQDPELHRALPELGMVKSVTINGDVAELEILLTISGCPMRDRLTRDIEAAVTAVEGIAAQKSPLESWMKSSAQTLRSCSVMAVKASSHLLRRIH